MKTVKEVLNDADPLRYEAVEFAIPQECRLQEILVEASRPNIPAIRHRRKVLSFAAATLIAIIALFVASRIWPIGVVDLQAAVRFEIRLAENAAGPGLREAKVDGGRTIYLHRETVVTNGDIAQARSVQEPRTSLYNVEVRFNDQGRKQMRAATESHIGKPMAILIDDKVVMAPIVKSAIGDAAIITGGFTKEQAERIVNGITAR
jgi:hypothetical protein